MLQYSDGTIITKCEQSLKKNGLRKPGKDVMAGKQIDAQLVRDEVAFAELYRCWIGPCAELIYGIDEETADKQVLPLFYEGAEEACCEEFQNLFSRFILGRGNTPLGGPIFAVTPCEQICENIDSELDGEPCYIRLRVKIVCLLTNSEPSQLFSEGVNWMRAFLTDESETDRIDIENGKKFPLILKRTEGEELVPKTLHNPGDEVCQIWIIYEGIKYPISLPPHGIIRVVFGDKALSYLVNVKGNISFNDSKTRNAVIQSNLYEQLSLQMYHAQYNQPFELDAGGVFLDAAADGEGGAVVLTNNGLYYTLDDKLVKMQKPPIRVYGAGISWARQFADGSLECNMRKKSDEAVQKAIAVVENADRSLMFRDESGAWDCMGGVAHKVTDKEFVDCMMGRFGDPDVCERVKGERMKLSIGYNGNLETK